LDPKESDKAKRMSKEQILAAFKEMKVISPLEANICPKENQVYLKMLLNEKPKQSLQN
jgi:hypothetical protein